MVEDCWFVDVTKLPGTGVYLDGKNHRLHLTATWPSGEVTRETFRTATTEPNYGGERPWLVCDRCGRRCRKMYSTDPTHPFACRLCLHLVYGSQYRKRPDFVLAFSWLRDRSLGASARRQRERRRQKKLDAMSEVQLLAYVLALRQSTSFAASNNRRDEKEK
jgi:hypothetical protein